MDCFEGGGGRSHLSATSRCGGLLLSLSADVRASDDAIALEGRLMEFNPFFCCGRCHWARGTNGVSPACCTGCRACRSDRSGCRCACADLRRACLSVSPLHVLLLDTCAADLSVV